MIDTPEKRAYFAQKTIDVEGNASDPNHHLYQLADSGLMVRRAHIKAKKPGEPVEILQITDMHLNELNERDLAENLPAIVSTREYRMWCRDRASLPSAENAMAVSPFFDLTVVTGDTLDYLTWGSLDLTVKTIWGVCPDALVTIGGHDVTRRMQGKVSDETTLESRLDILASAWKHDLFYTARTLCGRVTAIQLDNGGRGYTPDMAEKLARDLDDARVRGRVVLIFQHEPISTRNPAEHDVTPIHVNDGSGTRNFCDAFLGGAARPDSSGVYDLILHSADVIGGVFCGHWHSDFYTEIIAENGVIPQYVLTGNAYGKGHVLIVSVE